MRIISTLCLLLFSSVCFSQIEDLIRKAEYGNTTVKVIPYVCGLARNFSPAPVDLSSLQGNMERPKDSVLLKGLQIKALGVYAGTTTNRDTVRKQETKIVIRCGSRYFNETPLFVVDGVPVDNNLINDINPNDIENINVLKGATASALYGCRAARGVIIITTKSAKLKKFIIKDFLDGSRIPGATVSFISSDKKDTIMMAANDSGVVVTDKLKPSIGYQVYVSATGYKLLTQNFKNGYSKNGHELILERDIKICDEVIIGNVYKIVRCSRSFRCINVTKCPMHTIADTAYNFSFVPVKEQVVAVSVFPNPVQKGNTITIETTAQSEGQIEIRITGLDGKLLLSQPQKAFKGLNRFTINTDPRWSAGIYFVQVYANGKLHASDKVVIQ